MIGGDGDLHLHLAARVVDGGGTDSTPGAILRRGSRVLAAGAPEAIGQPAGARVTLHPDAVIVPALGNAHAHLDLSALGALPFDGDFPRWLGAIRDFRRGLDPGSAAESVRQGAHLSLAGGVALVGDVAGWPVGADAVDILTEAGLPGVAFVEVFGAGRGEARAMAMVAEVAALARAMAEEERRGAAGPGAVRVGIQPHAPYSTSARVLAHAMESGLPLSIHLAESAAEVEYCLGGGGPMRALLEEVGAIDRAGSESAPAEAHHPGRHPIDWYCDIARASGASAPSPRARSRAGEHRSVQAPVRLAVHLEEIDERHFTSLAETRTTAVFCPRASASFGRAGMPWRALRAAGVEVALGTDGRVSLDTTDRISTLDEMRFLFRRDGAELQETLPLATTAVARALGVPEGPFTLGPGEKPGLLTLACGGDPCRGILRGDGAPAWLFRRSSP